VVADRVADSGLKLLAATAEIEVVPVAGKPKEELDRALAGAHALIVRSETRVTSDLLARAPHLRVVARAGTGVDTIDVHAATRRGIAVMNAPGANTVSAGEHALGLLLALVRRIPDAAAAMRSGGWDRKKFEGTELRGKTMGVVGLGRIGAHVAQLARAFGMSVVAHDPYLLPERAAEIGVPLLSLAAGAMVGYGAARWLLPWLMRQPAIAARPNLGTRAAAIFGNHAPSLISRRASSIFGRSG